MCKWPHYSVIIGCVLCTSLLIPPTTVRGQGRAAHKFGQGTRIPLYSPQAKGFYVAQHNRGGPGDYHFTVMRISPDGTIDESIGDLVSKSWLVGAFIFHGADGYFLVARSDYTRNIWARALGSSWTTIGSIEDNDLLTMSSQGRLFVFHRIPDRPVKWREFRWRVRSYSGEGMIEEKEHHVTIDTTDWPARLGGPLPTTLLPLDKGTWLNVEVGVNPDSLLQSDSLREWPRDWLWYWIVDPEKGQIIDKGFHRIEDVSFGRVPGIINGLRVISHDSTGLSIVATTGEHPFDPGWPENEICLLRFSPEGKPLLPKGLESEIQLRAVDEIQTPVAQFAAYFGTYGRYRLYSMDRLGRITYSDLPRSVGQGGLR